MVRVRGRIAEGKPFRSSPFSLSEHATAVASVVHQQSVASLRLAPSRRRFLSVSLSLPSSTDLRFLILASSYKGYYQYLSSIVNSSKCCWYTLSEKEDSRFLVQHCILNSSTSLQCFELENKSPMESFLGFKEAPSELVEQKSSYARRLVPWLNWDEWIFVKDSIFSNSPDSIASAHERILAWRSRGCLPVLIEVTASIIEIQQKDPYFRVDLYTDALLSEEMLAMLYSMAIMRLVNGVVEKMRKKEEMSIAMAADAIGIPRMLIDVRHEGSHRELPSLQVVRSASVKALDWLKSYYWEPQSKAIPFQGDGNAKIRKEIKSKLRELAFYMKSNQSPQSCSPSLKRKCSKKQATKILKSLVQLYSSFSSEIVNLMLEYLMKALSSSELIEHGERASLGPTIHTILADWRDVILRFWDKEPELLLNLLKAVLHLIETQDAIKYEEGKQCFGILQSRAVFYQIDRLSSLFAWLVGILSKLASTEGNVSKSVLLELLHKCLLISAPSNKQLMDSALLLAKLMDDNSMMERVKKLSLLSLSNLEKANDESSLSMTPKNIFKLEESIHQAATKLELVKQHIMKNKTPMAIDCEPKKSRTWSLSKVWNPCPIGTLPRAVGSSGYLPTLGHIDNTKRIHECESTVAWKQSKDGAKRNATLDLHLLDNSSGKKMKETIEVAEIDHDVLLPMEGEKGCLLVDGVWMRVREEEILAIESAVRILV
ncbi:pre-rRNA-processing protein las1 isoform X2 [Senna tora]|uniref:Pre-rRNA-processing protein las1 isoform X2 n=1 Tax=Senna tora TaxID=362788 RepID=A0A834THA8_9FABA|nr:pre-rRNA-processing protein las1 isoform X2 [Senna tora]